jgi:hypothetical protein
VSRSRCIESKIFWQGKNLGKSRGGIVIKQTAEEAALLGSYRRKTNPPVGMNQRADRETYVALSERQSL